VVATHLDQDHIGGLPQVLANYQVQSLFLADTNDSDSFKKIAQAINSHQPSTLKIEPGNSGQRLLLGTGGGELLFLAPTDYQWAHHDPNLDKILKKHSSTETTLSDKKLVVNEVISENTEDRNDRSIVLLLRNNYFTALFTGDASLQQEIALREKGLITNIDLLKVGHHGSKTSTGSDLLETSQPEISAISCGLNNNFSHPSQQVLSRLQQQSVQTLRTDQLGEIELITNGFYYWTTTEK
jgi:beta-lactamase superfamily II metal-dependent hydrolase